MKIVMLKGLSASGKTSWAKEKVAQDGNWMIVSKDMIRPMLGKWTPRKEKNVITIRNVLIESAIKMRKNVIVDDTNLNPKHERCIAQIAKKLGVKFEINDSFLKETPESCIERDLHRGDKAVGASVIWDQYYTWVAPNVQNVLKNNFDKPRCVICDLDGTLALNLENRDPYDMKRVGEDSIDPFTGCVIDALNNYGTEASGNHYPMIILVSGREETCRKLTEDWLEKNCIKYDKLFMRKEGDRRPDDIVKEEIYHEHIEPFYGVLGVFDDRPKVARMWRKLGLRVAQLGYPEIEF